MSASLAGGSCALRALGAVLALTGALAPVTGAVGVQTVHAAGAPASAPGDDLLDAVSCAGTAACEAVGVADGHALAEGWDGAHWRGQHTPDPGGAGLSTLSSVWCTASSSCEAVGEFTDAARTETALVLGWDGTSWARQPVPVPPGALGSALSGVTCTGSACEAVGWYESAAGVDVPMADVWDGTSWARQHVPQPGVAVAALLDGVSCTAADACEAVGSYTAPGVDSRSLAEGWDGAHWHVQHVPDATAYDSALASVWCTGAGACEAVGDDVTSALASRTLAEGWDGTAWSRQPTPDTSGGGQTALSSVACTGAGACEAVGRGDDLRPLAEGWNGTKWRVQATPVSSGTDAVLAGVSCGGAGACEAAGSFWYQGSTTTLTLAEAWNGSAWAAQDTPDPT